MPRKNKFKDKWMQEDEFCEWLAPLQGNENQATCSTCCSTFSANLTTIKRHKKSKIHESNISLKDERTYNNQSIEDLTIEAEIKIAAFLAEHNIAFNITDHFVDFLKNTIPNMEVLNKLKLKRTKSTEVVKKDGDVSKNETICSLQKKTNFN